MSSLYLTTNAIEHALKDNNSSLLWVPITDDSFRSFVDRLFRKYESLILDQDDEIFDIVLTDYTFAIFIAQYLHINAVRNVCIDAKVEFIVDYHFKSLLAPNWKKLAVWYVREIKDTNWPKEWLRSKYYTLQYNDLGVFRILKESLGQSPICSIGRKGWLKDEFIKKYNIDFIQQMEPQLLLCGLELPANSKINYRGLIVEPLLNYLKETDEIFLRGADLNSISNAWVTRLRTVEAIYKSLREKKKPSRLLVTGGTNPLRKAMVLAYQRENVDVHVFHHGNDVGARVLEHVHRAEVSHCKNFVCPTRQIARNYEKCYQSLPTENRTRTAYSYLDTDYYKRLVDRAQIIPSAGSNQPKRFMIIGRPLNNLRLLDAHGAFFLHKIDLEYQLINALGKLADLLLYKMHPEWSAVAESLYGKCNCSLVNGIFEQVWQSADIFIFTTATTTTFEYSLCTNRPVILFDAKGNKWHHEVKKKLANRCEIVEYDINDFGKAILDQDEIEDAILRAAKKNLDQSFLEAFMW